MVAWLQNTNFLGIDALAEGVVNSEGDIIRFAQFKFNRRDGIEWIWIYLMQIKTELLFIVNTNNIVWMHHLTNGVRFDVIYPERGSIIHYP